MNETRFQLKCELKNTERILNDSKLRKKFRMKETKKSSTIKILHATAATISNSTERFNFSFQKEICADMYFLLLLLFFLFVLFIKFTILYVYVVLFLSFPLIVYSYFGSNHTHNCKNVSFPFRTKWILLFVLFFFSHICFFFLRLK